jgi:dTMP kinase
MFISFEGIDGSGKTTQVQHTVRALQDAGYQVLSTREPGGTPLGDRIRGLLLEKNDHPMHPRSELLLFCASRAQLVSEMLRPFLAGGGIVICDRYADSTLAYQGYGHGLNLDALRHILDFATGGLYPDVTVYLDMPPERGLERRHRGRFEGEEWNRLDDMELAFHQRVYHGYEQLIQRDPQRWLRIPADDAIDTVKTTLLKQLLPRVRQHMPAPDTAG